MIITSSEMASQDPHSIDLQNVLSNLMQINLAHQVKTLYRAQWHSASSYISEHKTVMLDSGRQTGKTTAIVHLFSNRDLIVCPNESMVQYTRSLMEHYYKNTKEGSRVLTIDGLKQWSRNRHSRSTVLNRIFIDDCRLRAHELDVVHYLITQFNGSQIIQVGS